MRVLVLGEAPWDLAAEDALLARLEGAAQA